MFTTTRILEVDLEENTLSKVLADYKKINEVRSDDFYLAEVYSENHVLIDVNRSRVYSAGHHHVRYNKFNKKVEITSMYYKKAYIIYLYLIMPLIPIIGDGKIDFISTLIFVGMLIGITLILFVGIKIESRNIGSELRKYLMSKMSKYDY